MTDSTHMAVFNKHFLFSEPLICFSKTLRELRVLETRSSLICQIITSHSLVQPLGKQPHGPQPRHPNVLCELRSVTGVGTCLLGHASSSLAVTNSPVRLILWLLPCFLMKKYLESFSPASCHCETQLLPSVRACNPLICWLAILSPQWTIPSVCAILPDHV